MTVAYESMTYAVGSNGHVIDLFDQLWLLICLIKLTDCSIKID